MSSMSIVTDPQLFAIKQADLVSAETTVPALPAVPPDPTQQRQFLEKIKEVVEVREGRRGNKLDSTITWRDLFEHGVVDVSINGNRLTGEPKTPIFTPRGLSEDFSTPQAPEHLSASGAFSNIILVWDRPDFASFAYTEIWRSDTNNIGNAQKIGTTTANIYSDTVGKVYTTKYYWVRFVNQNDVRGPFQSGGGVAGTTAQDPAELLTLLSGELSETQMTTNLNTRLNTYGDQYTVKVESNGYVSGFGLASTTKNSEPYSYFIFKADQFAFGAPGQNTVYPFVIQTTPTTVNGVSVPAGVYIDAAYMKNGTITNAKIADAAIDNAKIDSLNATKITAGYLSADRIESGSFDAKIATIDAAKITKGYLDMARIEDGAINNAKIGSSIQSSDWNDSTGTGRWKIDKAGNITVNNGTFRGTIDVSSASSGSRLVIKNNRIEVWSGTTLRVQIGELI